MLLSIALILIFGLALGELAGLLRLPKLTGMIAAGILLGSLGWLDPALLGISADLRKIALIIILTRAGLNLELSDLKKCGRPALLLSFVPAACEIVGVTLLAQLLLGLDIAEAATMGSVLAAVSPAVIVPKMLKLMEEKRGTDKQIPQMILAGASMDDVFVIVMFSVFSGLCAGGEVSAVSIVNIPVSILLGAAVGAVCGVIMALLFRKLHMRDSVKVILVMSLAFLLVTLEDFLPDFIGFSGLVAVMTAGIALRQREPERAVRISAKYSKLWTAAELMLFVLVGAEVDLNSIGGIWLPVLGVILGALAFRCAGVFLCLLRTRLCLKERLFCMLAYTPKATVQAAIGGVPLAMGLACGNVILSGAVLAILVTAAAGAFLIDLTAPRLLKKEE
ncbi:MAG TPA: potassium transporter [Ruminococcaceae bacterium]|nr:potassium transporter [Oscillospiraceae bacterium]HCK51356.1 potassium transporter [Oscillospiraceae bacterium]